MCPHDNAPQIAGYLRNVLNWANVLELVPLRFPGTKEEGVRTSSRVCGEAEKPQGAEKSGPRGEARDRSRQTEVPPTRIELVSSP